MNEQTENKTVETVEYAITPRPLDRLVIPSLPKPYYQDEAVTIYHGDCREILTTFPTWAFDLLLTDPPYGIGKKWKGGFSEKHGWGKAKGEAELRNEWDDTPIDNGTLALLRSKGKIQIFWGGNYFPLPPSRCWLIWNKPERGFTLSEAEMAWTNIDSVVRVFDAPRSDVGRQHPTQKPLKLMEWSILRAGTVETILDPFAGSGTTGLAAKNLGKKCTLIEREEKYCEIAAKRIGQGVLCF